MAVIKNNNTGESLLLSHVISEALVSKRKTSDSDTSIFGTSDQNPLDARTIRLAVKIFGSDREARYQKLEQFHSSNDLMTYVGKRTLTNCEIASINEMVTKETQAIVLTIDLKEILKSDIISEEVVDSTANEETEATLQNSINDNTEIGKVVTAPIALLESEQANADVVAYFDSVGNGSIDDFFSGRQTSATGGIL